MITGIHAIVFAEDAVRARAFFRDVLELESVDAGGGWLIFRLPPAEVACHPAEGAEARHELYLMCDDLPGDAGGAARQGRRAGRARSATQGWGVLARVEVPGMGQLGLYEPRHPSPLPGVGT